MRAGEDRGYMPSGTAASEKNVFKIPDDVKWDVSATLATTTITPYHALKEASLKLNEFLVIFGASGNRYNGKPVWKENGSKGYRNL